MRKAVVRLRRAGCAVAAMSVVGGVSAMPAQAAVVAAKPSSSFQTNGRVSAILFLNGTVYLGGKFTSVRPSGAPAGTGEVARNHLAAFDAATGALLPWNPGASAAVFSLAGTGNTVYVGGTFSKLGTSTRSRIGAVDATTGAVVSGFKPKLDAAVNSLAVGGGVVYAGGAFTTANGVARTSLAAFDATTGALSTAWAPSAGGNSSTTPTVTSVRLAPGGGLVYVGGGFTTIDGASQSHIAALSATTGVPSATFIHLERGPHLAGEVEHVLERDRSCRLGVAAPDRFEEHAMLAHGVVERRQAVERQVPDPKRHVEVAIEVARQVGVSRAPVHEAVDAGVQLDQRPLARGGALELCDQLGRLAAGRRHPRGPPHGRRRAARAVQRTSVMSDRLVMSMVEANVPRRG